MMTEGKAANALGGMTARACENCVKKRARWFCAADDAFLCQPCDTSVHSANQLASRHERVRLETSSFKAFGSRFDENIAPTWHQGFTRKARTPRNASSKPASSMLKEKGNSTLPLVPEISIDETSPDESEEKILCRVPVLEPFNLQADDDHQLNVLLNDDDDDHQQDLDIPELIASDAELAEFAADVESLLGAGMDEESFGMEELRAMEKQEEGLDACFEDKRVKIEDDQDDREVEDVIACHFDPALDMARESLNWDFHYSAPFGGEEEEVKLTTEEMALNDRGSKEEEKSMMFLKLNYETVITAWASQGSPWADATKLEFNPDDYWSDFMGTSPRELHPYEGGGGRICSRDEEREARVLRYREKRRTREFSKKIRYEVRKLNAEKRPRMKGRFVRRTSFAGPSSFPFLMSNKR